MRFQYAEKQQIHTYAKTGADTHAENIRNIWGKYREHIGNTSGTYAEHMRNAGNYGKYTEWSILYVLRKQRPHSNVYLFYMVVAYFLAYWFCVLLHLAYLLHIGVACLFFCINNDFMGCPRFHCFRRVNISSMSSIISISIISSISSNISISSIIRPDLVWARSCLF
jgi:hypothetical protein